MKNFSLFGLQINLIAYSQLKKMTITTSIYSIAFAIWGCFSTPFSSTCNSSAVEATNVTVDTRTTKRENRA